MTITVQVTLEEVWAAKESGMKHYRELVAKKFQAKGFAVVNYAELKYLMHKHVGVSIEGDTGKSILKL